MAQNVKPLVVTDTISTCNSTRMIVTSGTLSCSGSVATITTGGGGGSQTPWTSDINTSTYKLLNSSGHAVIYPTGQTLYNDGTAILSWVKASGTQWGLGDGSGNLLMDVNHQTLLDSSTLTALNFNLRTLNNSVTTTKLDWSGSSGVDIVINGTETSGWIPRVETEGSYNATPSVNTNNYDEYRQVVLSGVLTSITLSGTPHEGQSLIVRLEDTGSPQTLAFGTSFVASGNVALPTTTVASTLLSIQFVYDSTASKWVCTGIA